MSHRIRKYFRSADSRNVMLRNNILFSALLKIIGLGTSLLVVPITLHYLESESYGIWLTMSSILYWFTFFDIGLGNGMRNYLTQAISNNDYKLAKSYLSTTLALLALIAIIMAAAAVIPLYLLNLNKVFNTSSIPSATLRYVMLIAIVFTLVNFVIKNIGFIFIALQKYAINNLLAVSGNVAALVIIYILAKTTPSSLLYVVMAFTITPVVVYILASFPIFRKYPQLKPSIKSIDKSLATQIVGKGFGFFFIQITSCLVIFGSANLFITQFCGPESVTTYNIAYKYFNIIAIAYTIIISPMWNAYTDAYVKGDMDWIRRTFNRALAMWGLTLVGGILMLGLSQFFYHIWVGNTIEIPFSVSLCVLVYISFFNLNNCVTYLLNGLNIITIQILTSVIFTLIYLLSVLSLGKEWGIEGITICMATSYAMMSMIHLYQCRLIIKKEATGIWNK